MMTEVKISNTNGPVEMRGSGSWNLYQINDDINHLLACQDESMYVCTIDMRLGPGGNLIGTGIGRGEDKEISDIFGEWNDKTIKFTRQLRDDDAVVSYKGTWSEDFEAIKGTVKHGSVSTKFEMFLQSRASMKAKESKQSEHFCMNMNNYCKNFPDKMFFDFQIMSNDGEEIKAHKFILCSQSEYFAALFRKENPSHVQLDYPASIIRSCIDFLYVHDVKITVDNVQDILGFSNYINLTDLEDIASTFMIQNIDGTNAPGILMLSDALANETLMKAAIDFLAKNFTKCLGTNDSLQLIPKHLFKQLIWSKDLILYTDRGTVITGADREYGILSFIQMYVDVQNLQQEILTFLPYLRLNLTDDVAEKLFKTISTVKTPLEVLSSEPRNYAFRCVSSNNRSLWGVAPEHTFIEKQPFAALGNGEKCIDSIVVTEKEWDNTILVSGLKIQWSNGKSDVVGSQEGNQVTMTVPDGEHVVSVVGKSGWYVDSLGLITSSGKVLGPAGGEGGGKRNALACLGQHCEITKTFLDGIKGFIVRTNSNPDAWTVARLEFIFISATNIHQDDTVVADTTGEDDTDEWDDNFSDTDEWPENNLSDDDEED